MSRENITELKKRLSETQFSYLPAGNHSIEEFYRTTKNNFPEYCDDNYLCSTNCESGHDQPEWKHVVRSYMQTAKKRGKISLVSRGIWTVH
jgi:hypothetical protein